ncbi:class I SAM-dependent methyltransferase [Halobaculum gomorrense]|uniref:Methyltransferase domain-containing protein n=1 Tax=Halobaculum gomorrense TaxID=43928 RepID=A0A1M5RB46_9EURY|nr:class I SAM-dependent methyltransferase [Halobaculum gomorrense]SHH23299.1 Methyltransferase domain-containing protein [Halobaculum gomorrense]
MNADDLRDAWADRTGEFSPRYYAHYGPNEVSEVLADRLGGAVGRDARVLELGCGSGRHLAHLHAAGFSDLAGVDINPDSFDVLREEYPDLADAGSFHAGAIADVLPGFDDREFDAVYSVETLQHVHPEEMSPTFDEVARVAGDLLVTVELEGDADGGIVEVDEGLPLYRHDWGSVFESRGFDQVAVEPLGHDTVRVFERAD